MHIAIWQPVCGRAHGVLPQGFFGGGLHEMLRVVVCRRWPFMPFPTFGFARISLRVEVGLHSTQVNHSYQLVLFVLHMQIAAPATVIFGSQQILLDKARAQSVEHALVAQNLGDGVQCVFAALFIVE